MGSGILIAALPRIAKDVNIPDGLILWPAAVYALAAGCLLHVFGAIGDIVGPKSMWVVGSFLFVVFTLAVGLAATSMQIILFRTCLGMAMSMCLPTTVSLITNTFPRGQWRNTAFAMNGMAQPLGYALGLVLGGIFTDTIGWRWSYYIMAMLNFCVSVTSIWSLPTVTHPSQKEWTQQLREDVDWVGAIILSISLGMLMYVLGTVTSDHRNLRKAPNITLLSISLALLAGLPCWMHWQAKHDRPALIPNRLWRQATFTSACLGVFFSWASLNGIEYFTTLFFQQVQGLPALESSLRYFSQIIMGTSVNIVLVYLISRVRVVVLAVASACATLVSPALMATVGVDASYWAGPCWALFLCPVNPWAGGVFSQFAQFGNSVGLAITAVIAASVTEHSNELGGKNRLMDGFRAAFWAIFASTGAVIVISAVGFRKAGIIGQKGTVDEDMPTKTPDAGSPC
ncbi:hypothetical protein DL766_008604 [Monosporascus sp. MC13-8B]|uniref:Major facilitator superfamily (MFS) profile domain-containing protein n=1 Tax=Monosporascus cannonballus TaxID=155416 RepID=A0ABY0H7W9_9PEZI|nr:hypothetical protein DL763_007264 [Monosporascus cannonballus]RYO87147.1 hypothetical protein DL762_004351 [Monosporascus cannonballus]RYP18782.1 hypothetical protein DL766_008604 [Monosporascus sp. MC13-8B]